MGLKADGMGPVMASWGDVEAYDVAMRLELELWEKRALLRLAHLRASIQSEQQSKASKQKAP
jgi:hypothetical protein